MRKFSKKAIATVAAGSALVIGGGGVAFAYWTSSGTGTGTATTSAGAANLSFGSTTTDGTSALSAMYPGDTAQSFQATLTNNATNKAYVSAVKAYLTIDSSHATAGCSASDYLLGNATATTLSPAPGDAASATALTWTAQELAASGSDKATGKIQFNDKNTSQDACKGATVTINYLAS
jgi:hypothetical protein